MDKRHGISYLFSMDNDSSSSKDLAPSGLDAPLSLHVSDTATADTAIDDTKDAPRESSQEHEHVVVIFGGGHIAQEVAVQATHVGFTVDVLDSRETYAQAERFPAARQVLHCADYAFFDEIYPVDARHYAVILTHSHAADQTLLEALLPTEARYIGVIGSMRKKEAMFSALRQHGVPDAELACVRCPIGVPIGPESPEEVAISIVAELIAARRGCLPPPRPPRPPRC